MGPCCVEGCTGVTEETVYFEFPTSRGLRRKWLEMIKIPSKVPLGTVVCNQHFNPDDYEIVRGKVRLKRKVVPTLKLYNLSKPSNTSSDKKPNKKTENKKLPGEKCIDNDEVPPQPDSTTGNIEKSSETPGADEEMVDKVEESNKSEAICKVVSKESESSDKMIDNRVPPLPDPKQPPDFEDMITNYQIKNSKPNSLLPQEKQIEVPQITTEVVPVEFEVGTDAPPVFIEISVDKDNSANASSQDCLMVLESVQVEVDPATLMLAERDYDDEIDLDQNSVEELPIKKDDPISLLTSSDEDDVIIQEPHIDTVEVSDETDEDDMPLVKLLKKKPLIKKMTKKRTKKAPYNREDVRQLLWTGVYGFYCVQCQFRTVDNVEYAMHLQEHQKVLQVCHICSYTSASKTQFSRHVRKHKEEKKFKCQLCEYRARHKMSLIYHMQCHETNVNSVRSVKNGFKCMKCRFQSNVKSAVLKHVRLCKKNVQVFSCSLCHYATKRRSDLKRHLSNIHKNDKGNDSDSNSNSKWV